MMIARALAVLTLVLGLAAAAPAQQPAVSAADKAAIRDVIQGQVDAFRRDDADAAFGFASPMIQGMFGQSAIFMDMVRQGYRPVYRPQAFDFREVVVLNGQIVQKVHVIGPDGRPVTALYPMTQLPDGRWRIDGCYLQAPDEHQA
jgi:ketosteroid isomerase-like protein